jgi:hypothetical protein
MVLLYLAVLLDSEISCTRDGSPVHILDLGYASENEKLKVPSDFHFLRPICGLLWNLMNCTAFTASSHHYDPDCQITLMPFIQMSF